MDLREANFKFNYDYSIFLTFKSKENNKKFNNFKKEICDDIVNFYCSFFIFYLLKIMI